MKKAASSALGCLTGLTSFVVYGLGALIHIATVAIAYGESGILGAILTLALPFLAEIFWAVRISQIRGSWLNPYTEWLLLYVVLFVAMYAIAFLLSLFVEKEQ